MKLSAFRFRIIASAVVSALVAVLLVWATATAAVHLLNPLPRVKLSDSVARMCARYPEDWVGVQIGHSVLTAADEGGVLVGTGLTLADFPALAPGDSATLTDREQWATLTRLAESGPCAYLLAVEGPPPALIDSLRLGASGGALLAFLAVGGLTWVLAVQPLVRRIDRIRQAALGIGVSGYRSADDRVGDALADISAVLDASHGRILDDRSELVRRHQALEQHLAEIAHDLRTPIGSLMLAIQEARASAGTAAADQATARALGDAAYLSALVENLHQAARLRHGLDPREGAVDLREVLTRLEVRFRALGEATGVDVAVAVPERPVIVQCTPVLAERAIANLLDNAVSHGAKRVAARLESAGGRFALTVLDDGPGVAEPADLALRTFTDRADRPRSSGLGVAITNEVARRVGWTVTYGAGEEGGLSVEVSGACGAGDLVDPFNPGPSA